MPLRRKKDMNRDLEPLLEEQGKRNDDFGGKETPEAEELPSGTFCVTLSRSSAWGWAVSLMLKQ